MTLANPRTLDPSLRAGREAGAAIQSARDIDTGLRRCCAPRNDDAEGPHHPAVMPEKAGGFETRPYINREISCRGRFETCPVAP